MAVGGCSQSMVLEGTGYEAVWESARKVVLAYAYDPSEMRPFVGPPRYPVHVDDKASGKLAVSVGRFLADVRLVARVRDLGDGRVKVAVCHYRGWSWASPYHSRSQRQEAHVLKQIREAHEKPAEKFPAGGTAEAEEKRLPDAPQSGTHDGGTPPETTPAGGPGQAPSQP